MMKRISVFLFGAAMMVLASCQKSLELGNDQLSVVFDKSDEGWKAQEVKVKSEGEWKNAGIASGEYTLLFSEGKPDSVSTELKTTTGVVFPEPVYKYLLRGWMESTRPVPLNTAGNAFHFFPAEASRNGDVISFRYDNEVATIISSWKIDANHPSVIQVEEILIAKKDGYYSLATPTLSKVKEEDMKWVTVPGYFQGNEVGTNTVATYGYGHGIPKLPLIYRERAASTLSPIVDTRDDISLAVIPQPGLSRDPWEGDRFTQENWFIGLSHRNRKAALSPTLYYPVLGEPHSGLKAGDTVNFTFQYRIIHGDWFDNLNYAANEVYQFKKGKDLHRNKQSLTRRVERMHQYLVNTKTSMWNVEQYDGVKIGAQSYMGGVVGSDRDAMKNADYGAMWMLTSATDDQFLKNQVLPFALNFKLRQQETKPGFFQGAAIGQYYLAKKKVFVEEWGEFIEPISLTYYTMLDMGNVALFESDNQLLRERLRLGADLLLKWQKEDGSWEVAYDRKTHEPLFTDIKDYRPTFYGLVVAYRLLKDEKYLIAARKGADWLMENSVSKGQFLGVCGDARYAPDFARGQTAQTLLDLYEITKETKYKEAAILAARIYTASIYTHPIATKEVKQVKKKQREDWEITQAGLSFEHGGLLGSAQRHGPIQLASHAGMFVRMFQLTNDSLFVDMARAGAIGRDAFVDSATSVASYYWNAMNNGAGPYPHHAWWQIGWITDYLLAEAELRSEGQIVFERGFVTPKVGPHQTYGFSPGKIYGEQAKLIIRDEMITIDNPNVEWITAISLDKKKLFVIVLNDLNEPVQTSVALHPDKCEWGKKVKSIVSVSDGKSLSTDDHIMVSLSGYGLQVYSIELQ